jgi:hypothetical protein
MIPGASPWGVLAFSEPTQTPETKCQAKNNAQLPGDLPRQGWSRAPRVRRLESAKWRTPSLPESPKLPKLSARHKKLGGAQKLRNEVAGTNATPQTPETPEIKCQAQKLGEAQKLGDGVAIPRDNKR